VTAWNQVREAHKHLRQTVRIPMRADLLDEISSLEARAEHEREIDKRENRDPVAPGLAEQIQGLEQELTDSEVTFKFQALGRRAYAKLVAEHPPTDEQKAAAVEAGNRSLYNNDTFPPALLAAACIEPADTTYDDMLDVWENWSEGQVAPLWSACLTANMAAADVGPKSQIASAILNGSAKS
jgi:hypothetical protein